MKHLKKAKRLIASIITMALIMSMMTITAFAADTYTLTLTGTVSGHTYTAYQIFSGTAGDSALTGISWGDGIYSTGFLSALASDDDLKSFFTTSDTAAEVANTIQASTFTAANLIQFAELAGSNVSTTSAGLVTATSTTADITGLSAGYYLIVDSYSSTTNSDYSLARYSLIMVVSDTSASIKTVQPTIDKKIKHNDDSTWGVVGDNQIGDTVEFYTTVTVPDVTGYDEYEIVVYDLFSDEISFDTDSIVVTIGSLDGTKLYSSSVSTYSSYITVNQTASTTYTFTVTFDIKGLIDGKAISSGDTLYIYYTGTLTDSAKVSSTTNSTQYQTNKTWMTYSNNPYDTSSTGTSEKVIVYDWTFQVTVNKVDSTNTSTTLSGATFVLATASGLTVSYDSSTSTLTAKDSSGNDATSSLVELVAESSSSGTYTVDDGTDSTASTTYLLSVDSDGALVIKGLDDYTTYYLYEVVAPSGYTLLSSPIPFKIAADYDETGSTLSSYSVSLTTESSDASVDSSSNVITVKNTSSSALPSTGGAGTTMLYFLGTILVAGAVVLLVVKRTRSHAA